MAKRAIEYRRLSDIWLFKKWPIESLDARDYDIPPFADIAGVGSVVDEVIDNVLKGVGGVYLVIGSSGSGKTTLAKVCFDKLRRLGSWALYFNASGYGFRELLNSLCSSLNCSRKTIDDLVEAIEVKSYEEGCIAIFIDDIDRMRDQGSIFTLITKVTNKYREAIAKFLVLFTMTREHYAKLLESKDFRIIAKDLRIVNLDDKLVSSPDDVNRLFYAHLNRVRPKILDSKAYSTLSKYPLYPIKDKRVIDVLFDAIGRDTPRTYLSKLNELLRIAAETRSREITLAHVGVLLRRLAEGRKLAGIAAILTNTYIKGMLVGALAVLGAVMIALALSGLAPIPLRLAYSILGACCLLASIGLHIKQFLGRR